MAMSTIEVEALRKNFFSTFVAVFEKSVDSQLSDVMWLRNALTMREGRMGYRFVQLGTCSEQEVQEIQRRYTEAGWQRVQVQAFEEAGRRMVRMDVSLPEEMLEPA